MTNKIQTLDLLHEEIITKRTVIPGEYCRSVSINQTDGNFVVTRPLDDSIVIYPQSPNTASTKIISSKYINNLQAFGYLNFPLDAKFDTLRRLIWVADTKNDRIIKIDYNDKSAKSEVIVSYFPHVIVVNENDGGIFVRGYSSEGVGFIKRLSFDGEVINAIEFPDSFPVVGFELSGSQNEAMLMNLPTTVDFDHVRDRLWWISSGKIYMASLYNSEIYVYNLSELHNCTHIYGVEVEYETGNVFVGGRPLDFEGTSNDKYSVLFYIYKDNSFVISKSIVSDSEWS